MMLNRTGLLIAVLAIGLYSVSCSFVAPDPMAYSREWEEVDKLINQQLPKSALQKVRAIYDNALRYDTYPQIVKAAVQRIQLESETGDGDDLLYIVDGLKKEVKQAPFPASALLHSVIAAAYSTYYEQNFWEITSRPSVGGDSSATPDTWDAPTFYRTIRKHLQLSLQQRDELRDIPAGEYIEILETEGRPSIGLYSLFDVLACRALVFYANGNFESIIEQPGIPFTLTSLDAFAPTEEFIQQDLYTADTLSMRYNALELFRDLLRAHENDDEPWALVDYDIRRLKYMRMIAQHEERDSAYYAALTALGNRYREHAVWADVAFERAWYEWGKSNTFSFGRLTPNLTVDLEKIVKLCDSTHRFFSSRGYYSCLELKSEIQNKEYNISVAETIAPGKPFSIPVRYRNTDSLVFTLIRVDASQHEPSMQEAEVTNKFLYDRWEKQWTVQLPKAHDYRSHEVSIEGPAVGYGRYQLIVQLRKEEVPGKAPNVTFRATDLAVVSNPSSDVWRQDELYVVNAVTGEPVHGGVTVHTYKAVDKNTPVVKWRTASYQFPRQGAFRPYEHSDSYYLSLRRGNDSCVFDDEIYSYDYEPSSQERPRAHIFTDRSLYRPGQQIYIKVLLADGAGKKVVPNRTLKVYFTKNGNEDRDTMILRTNEWGSASGVYTVPQYGFTGMMRIWPEYSHNVAIVQVEEYKRPTFAVELDTPRIAALWDTVVCRGSAKGFAGMAMQNATVRFQVDRSRVFWRGGIQSGSDGVIASGVTTTDDKGEFTVKFLAVPDPSQPKKTQPEYLFSMRADVTDAAGETRSTALDVRLAYSMLRPTIVAKDWIEKTASDSIEVWVQTLNGQPAIASGSIQIEKLARPENPDRWLAVDEGKSQPAWSYPPGHSVSPLDGIPEDTALRQVVFSKEITSGADGRCRLALPVREVGLYRISVRIVDKRGERSTQERRIMVYDTRAQRPPYPIPLMLIPVQTSVLPGGKARVALATSFVGAYVFFKIERHGKTEIQWLQLGAEQRIVEIPIAESDRGGVRVYCTAVHNYRSYTEVVEIDVPWIDKQLTFEVNSFRDKITPGALEQWRFTIRGWKSEKVAAEMLASMYDASLDALAEGVYWPDVERRGMPGSSIPETLTLDVQSDFYAGKASTSYYIRSLISMKLPTNRLYSFAAKPDIASITGSTGMWGDGIRKSILSNLPPPPSGDAFALMRNGVGRQSIGVSGDIAGYEAGLYGQGVTANVSVARSPMENAQRGVALDDVVPRRNLRETAFFFPHLYANSNGSVGFSFAAPEALTRWRLMCFAHTKDLRTGQFSKETVTQKDLMVVPHIPRFAREGDVVSIAARIVGLADKELSGSVRLELFDAATMKPLTGIAKNTEEKFQVVKEGSTVVDWNIAVPAGITAIVSRITAASGMYSDGEESAMPVLPAAELITEALPMWIRGNSTRQFRLDALAKGAGGTSLHHRGAVLEVTSAPAWYAVLSLPYLLDFPHECSEQLFSRVYASTIASSIVQKQPAIRRVFEQWRKGGEPAMAERMRLLQSTIKTETPMAIDGGSEADMRKNIALLLDPERQRNSVRDAWQKLQKVQQSDGGWPWFPGMKSDTYVTQYILSGFGKLGSLGVNWDIRTDWSLSKALEFCDRESVERYRRVRESNKLPEVIDALSCQYLYVRSFYDTQNLDTNEHAALDYWRNKAAGSWQKCSLMEQAMIALAQHRFGNTAVASAIIRSLNERALRSDEFGMYWKYYTAVWWNQAPVETQSLLIELYDEVAHDSRAVEDMKIWLLMQKRAHHWGTTMATANACYALLQRGTNLLSSAPVEVSLGNPAVRLTSLKSDDMGYARTSWKGAEITPSIGTVSLAKRTPGSAWASLIWQYSQPAQYVRKTTGPLSVQRTLYRNVSGIPGATPEPVANGSSIYIGDEVIVKLEISLDRDMEYVQLTDTRAAALEPVQTTSGYRYQSGIGHYMSIHDASVNFFFQWLPKGKHIFYYSLRASHTGYFSGGLASIQCVYAPEFAGHSDGIQMHVAPAFARSTVHSKPTTSMR